MIEPVGTGTRSAKPVSLPLSSGITSPTALAAPVVEGMMLIAGGAGTVGVVVDLVGHALVVGVGVAGRHQALFDPERLVQHLGHRGQAVRRARGVRDDPVLGFERCRR